MEENILIGYKGWLLENTTRVKKSNNAGILKALKCYEPYKPESTNTQKGPRTVQDQYARHRTVGPRGVEWRRVAKLYNKTQYARMSFGT